MTIRSRRRNGAAGSMVTLSESSFKDEAGRREKQPRDEQAFDENDLTVCDIMGDWGPYQWSLLLFATFYSALAGFTVVFGPMVTPQMGHICDNGSPNLLSTIIGPSSTSTSNSTSDSLSRMTDVGQEREHPIILKPNWSNYSEPQNECSAGLSDGQQQVKCHKFFYDDEKFGEMLTNHFNLVCDREWLKSLVSSAALVGMLISSVTLGLLSDKFGRLRCIQLSFVISALANAVAILAPDYYLFSVCILLMSFAQVGASNALFALLMEATSPRLRFVPIFEYGAGWALGTCLVPLVNYLTRDYRLLMAVLLGWQLLLGPWLHFGVFESIRWLLSEGHINRAQIELRRACRMNRVETGACLAQDIAQIQAQQVRKASRIIEDELAPARLARALENELKVTTQELDLLSAAIKRSFGFDGVETAIFDQRPPKGSCERNDEIPVVEDNLRQTQDLANIRRLSALSAISPTLARKSFSIAIGADGGCIADQQTTETTTTQVDAEAGEQPAAKQSNGNKRVSLASPIIAESLLPGEQNLSQADEPKMEHAKQLGQVKEGEENLALAQRRQILEEHASSLTTQGLIQLAMKYSKSVEELEEGSCFVVRMFHPKLWRSTLILMLVSIMYETTYYGLIQTNKHVGKSVEWNYVLGSLSELSAVLVSCFMLAFWSRRFSLITTTSLGALCCMAMALTYQLIPQEPNNNSNQPKLDLLDLNSALSLKLDQVDSQVIEGNKLKLDESQLLTSPQQQPQPHELLLSFGQNEARINLLELKQWINLIIMLLGKFIVAVGIQIASAITMESFPNNLRQTGLGAIVFVARVCSILAPFLFNDTSEEKLLLRTTLYALTVIGLVVCLLMPIMLRDNKDKELCDRMHDIAD